MVKNAGKFYENNASYLSNAVKNQSDFHSKNLQHFKDARDAYLQQVLFVNFNQCICIFMGPYLVSLASLCGSLAMCSTFSAAIVEAFPSREQHPPSMCYSYFSPAADLTSS